MVDKVVILDPREDRHQGIWEPVRRLPHLEGSIVGVIDNGLPESTPFMKALSTVISERYGKVILKTKPSQSRGASSALLDEFASKYHAVVTGRGD